MHRISDIYFVGGFGTVQWVDVAEYASAKPDQIAMIEPHHTLKVRLAACWTPWGGGRAGTLLCQAACPVLC